MQDAYREKGIPELVDLVTSDVGEPLNDGALDAAVSIRPFHHGVSTSLDEIRRY